MFNKLLFPLGVVLAISALGSALKCNVCTYWTTQPKEQQKCTTTVNCPTGTSYCYTGSGAYQNGTEIVDRDCDTAADCPDAEGWCNRVTTKLNLKSCAIACCNTDNCNNYTPSSATDVMVTKFTLSLMVIVGFIFA
ncbi:Hypothetical predicted protein [Paramuricea clavata]|uniref:Uncharacterized protein n=1 Tax=Paramuricea clavata TaxID=317549 RepID=A0A7D9IRZ6_PARCT|nr:Hypothetical predicted protein [Paramuricea clavata]